MQKWRPLPTLLAMTTIWAICAASSEIEKLTGHPGRDGVRIISLAVFATVILAMATERGGWPVWKRIAFFPACLLTHAVLTIPASGALGILMHIPGHVRSVGEQRAVFLFAALPILAYAMWRSRLFVETERGSYNVVLQQETPLGSRLPEGKSQ